jgi:hypothetical protein
MWWRGKQDVFLQEHCGKVHFEALSQVRMAKAHGAVFPLAATYEGHLRETSPALGMENIHLFHLLS